MLKTNTFFRILKKKKSGLRVKYNDVNELIFLFKIIQATPVRIKWKIGVSAESPGYFR